MYRLWDKSFKPLYKSFFKSEDYGKYFREDKDWPSDLFPSIPEKPENKKGGARFLTSKSLKEEKKEEIKVTEAKPAAKSFRSNTIGSSFTMERDNINSLLNKKK